MSYRVIISFLIRGMTQPKPATVKSRRRLRLAGENAERVHAEGSWSPSGEPHTFARTANTIVVSTSSVIASRELGTLTD